MVAGGDAAAAARQVAGAAGAVSLEDGLSRGVPWRPVGATDPEPHRFGSRGFHSSAAPIILAWLSLLRLLYVVPISPSSRPPRGGNCNKAVLLRLIGYCPAAARGPAHTFFLCP
eukprot:SAG11_NODE_380_length_9956_cov_6.339454_1_plen_114_part_00